MFFSKRKPIVVPQVPAAAVNAVCMALELIYEAKKARFKDYTVTSRRFNEYMLVVTLTGHACVVIKTIADVPEFRSSSHDVSAEIIVRNSEKKGEDASVEYYAVHTIETGGKKYRVQWDSPDEYRVQRYDKDPLADAWVNSYEMKSVIEFPFSLHIRADLLGARITEMRHLLRWNLPQLVEKIGIGPAHYVQRELKKIGLNLAAES